MEPVRKSQRELEIIYEADKIQHLLKKYLANQTLFVQGYDPPHPVKLVGFTELNTVSLDMGQLEPAADAELTIFRILGRYMHLYCKFIGPTGQGNLYHAVVQHAAISRMDRSALRLPVQGDEIYLTNFRASKHTIDATLFNIPTSVKVNFGTVEQELKKKHDFAKIDVFAKRGDLLDEIRKSGLPVLVRDAREPAGFKPPGPGYFDYAAYLDDNIRKTIEQYRREKALSEIIVPVIYVTHDFSSIPLGYIRVQSRTRAYTEDDVAEIRELAFQLVDRIRDSNTVFIQEKQEVINLSRGGLKCLITHPELKEYLQRQNGFTFDLVFKMQAPITLYGVIRGAYATRGTGELTLSIQISGSSSRDGEMKRFLDNIQRYEARYIEQLEKRKKLLGQK